MSLSRKASELFIGGIAETVGWRGPPKRRIDLDGKIKHKFIVSDESFGEAQVIWDWLMEQNYGPQDMKAWLDNLGYKKASYAAIGRLVANTILREGEYILLKRWNRKQFAIIDVNAEVYDLTDFSGINLREGETNRIDVWSAPMRPLHEVIGSPRTVIGLEDEDFYYAGVHNVIVGFYRDVGLALPQPVPDARGLFT